MVALINHLLTYLLTRVISSVALNGFYHP